jgi:hypothetical protein
LEYGNHKTIPFSVQADDFIYIHDHGAYTTACATTFNGFPIPNTVVIDAGFLNLQIRMEQDYRPFRGAIQIRKWENSVLSGCRFWC